MTASSDDPGEGAPILLRLDPEEPEAGCAFTLRADIDPEALPGATDLVILDAGGREIARTDLVETDEGLEAEPLILTAPLEAGDHPWRACLVAEDGEQGAEAPGPVAVALPLRVRAHAVSVAVWGLPPVISLGESVTFHVGLKCPCGCDTAGWPFALTDGEGRTIYEGCVGHAPWAGTEGLNFAEVTLPAPEAEGAETWHVVSGPADHPASHSGGRAELRLIARPAPEVTITVVVTDAATGAAVPRAKVVAHPYRTLAGDDGVARLAVAKGRYTIQVSGQKYFASRTEGEIEEDVTITAALEIDREFTDADAWA